MRLEIENQKFFFKMVNKGHKVDIFNKEISSIDFFALVGKGLKHLKHSYSMQSALYDTLEFCL